jgi:multidrug resistance efflux pump
LSARAAAAAARAEADRRRAGSTRQLRAAQGETAALEAEIAELDHRIAAASGAVEVAAAAAARLAAEVERRALRAPAAGRLGAVAALRPGDPVVEGAELATILPEAPLQVVAAFDPGPALGHLRPGQRARLRLAAFPWTVWGAVDAEVIAVADAPLAGALRVELRPLPAPGGPPLQHGQPLEVEVDAGETTALALILRAAAQLGPAPAPAP